MFEIKKISRDKIINLLYFYVVVLNLFFLPTALFAQVDLVKEIVSEGYPAALRWNNIEAKQLEVDKSQWLYRDKLHQINLAPKQSSYVHLNANEDLRVLATQQSFGDKDLLVEASQDGRLFTPVQIFSDQSRHNYVVFRDYQNNRIIRINNQSENSLRLALFTSRTDSIKKLLAYRKQVDLALENVLLTQNPQWKTTRYQWLKRNRSTISIIEGPLRIKLNVRLKYEDFQYSRQRIQFYYAIGDQPEQSVHIETALDQKAVYTVNYKNVAVSREESFYIDIPSGKHRLTLQASDDSYIRLLALEHSDYLFPDLNDTMPEMSVVRKKYTKIRQHKPDLKHLINKQDFIDSLFNVQWLVRFLAINNELRGSALDAVALLKYSVNQKLALKETRNLLQNVKAQNSQFRKLLPYQVVDGAIKHQTFLIPRLKKRQENPQNTFVHDNNLAPVCATRTAKFFNLPDTSSKAIKYRLPKRQQAFELRLIVKNTHNHADNILDMPVLKERFYLKFDNQAAQTFSLYDGIVKSSGFLDTQLVEACLSRSLKRQSRQAFYPVQQIHTLSDVNVYTLNVPAGVQEISLWQETLNSSNARPLSIALQYQDGRPYEMDERLFLRLLARTQADMLDKYLIPLLKENKQTASPSSMLVRFQSEQKITFEESYRLRQHWQPLKRFVASRMKYFRGQYQSHTKVTDYHSENYLSQQYRLLLRKEKQAQWVEIIEQIAQLKISPESDYYVRLQKLFFKALEQQGESLLRERLLKAVILDNLNTDMTRYAFKALERDYQTYEQEEKLLQLYVAMVLKNTAAKEQLYYYRQLAIALVKQGYEQFGLQIGLLLPNDNELSNYLLQAAWNTKNWDYFSYLEKRPAISQSRSVLSLLHAYRTGNMQQLARQLAQQAQSSDYRVRLIKQMITLNQAFYTADRQSILKAWTDYQQWQIENVDNKPWSNWLWRNAEQLITYTPGSLTLYNPDRDLHQSGFLLERKKSIELQVVGPLKLRINVRLLYDKVTERPKYSTLTLQDNGHPFVSAVYGSIPAYGQRIIEWPDRVMGTQQIFEYDVAPGVHKIELKLNQHSAILSLRARQSAMQMPFIPNILSVDMLDSLTASKQNLQVDNVEPGFTKCLSKGCMFLFSGQKQIALPRIRFFNHIEYVDKGTKNSYVLKDVLSTVIYEQKDFLPKRLFDHRYFRQKMLNLCVYKDKSTLPVMLEALEGVGDDVQNNRPLCNDNRKSEAEKVLRLLTELLIYRKHNAQADSAVETLAGFLVDQYSTFPSVHYFRRYFDQKVRWERLETVTESAGVRLEAQQGWQPLSASMRIRKALLGNPQVSMVLQDSRISGLKIRTNSDVRLKLSIDSKVLPFKYKNAIKFRYRLNNHAWQNMYIKPNQGQVYQWFSLPAGQHSLNVQWLNPYVNQYVLIKLEKVTPQGKELLRAEESYSYHIATDSEPVEMTLKGPVRLKVFGRNHSDTSMQYVYVPSGWHRIRLNNEVGHQDTLYRIYQAIYDSHVKRPESDPAGKPSTELPFSNWLKELGIQTDDNGGMEADKKLLIIDRYPVGRQEDGTLAFGALWSQARDREDNLSEVQPSDYYEVNLSHYYFSEQLNTYFDTKLLLRTPDSGKVVYGLEETLFIQPDWLSFAVRYDIRFYSQEYRSDQGQERASSVQQRLGVEKLFHISPKWSHLGKLSIFDKHYNNKGFADNKADLDYDVWNEFGDIHDKGLVLEDTWYYYPWLDTRLSGGFKLYSDEFYNLARPEHLTLNLGWLQLLDKFIINVDYQWRYYYKQDGRNWNRQSNSNKSIFNTSIFWESWVSPVNRLLTNLKLSFDSKRNDLSATLGFMYYFDQGSGFKHFRPYSMSFRDLRERKRYWHVNNEVNMIPQPGTE